MLTMTGAATISGSTEDRTRRVGNDASAVAAIEHEHPETGTRIDGASGVGAGQGDLVVQLPVVRSAGARPGRLVIGHPLIDGLLLLSIEGHASPPVGGSDHPTSAG